MGCQHRSDLVIRLSSMNHCRLPELCGQLQLSLEGAELGVSGRMIIMEIETGFAYRNDSRIAQDLAEPGLRIRSPPPSIVRMDAGRGYQS